MTELKSFDRDKTPIDDIAPNPKRVRLDNGESSAAPPDITDPYPPRADGSVVSDEELSEDLEPEEGVDYMDDGGLDLPVEDDDEVKDENIATNVEENVSINLPHIPNSRVKAFLKSAFPHLQLGRQPLELIKEVALAISMDFIAGTIQEKVWSIDDPRYLDKAHMRLTREDGLKFLELHSEENPWGLFAHTQNWQGLQWRGEVPTGEEVTKPQRSKEKVDERQPLITNFFTKSV